MVRNCGELPEYRVSPHTSALEESDLLSLSVTAHSADKNTMTASSKLLTADSLASEVTPPMWRDKVKCLKVSQPPRAHQHGSY
jgi:hypothetical protein